MQYNTVNSQPIRLKLCQTHESWFDFILKLFFKVQVIKRHFIMTRVGISGYSFAVFCTFALSLCLEMRTRSEVVRGKMAASTLVAFKPVCLSVGIQNIKSPSARDPLVLVHSFPR